ncbi:LysM peptidoglycan-binding domain-containing protein [bacterium]|nr:LysM peptidoglycan-binding domain-containing protein [bacterium]
MRHVWSIALIILAAACSRVGEHAHRFVDRALELKEAEQYDEALRSLRKAIDVNPKCEDAYLEMALIYDDYLGDRSNAVVNYERYLAVAANDAMRERVKGWLDAARHDMAIVAGEEDAQGAAGIDQRLHEEVARRERQFKLLAQQLSGKYEAEVESLRQELINAREELSTIRGENSALRSQDANQELARLLRQAASNENLIARLKTEVEARGEDAASAVQSQSSLQALVTNLQAELHARTHSVQSARALGESNAVLAAERQLLLSKLQGAENQRGELQLQLADLAARFASATAGLAVARTGAAQTPTGDAAAILELYMRATNDLFALRNQMRFQNQERDSYVDTMNKMRALLAEKDEALSAVQAEAGKLRAGLQSPEDVETLRQSLASEQENRTKFEKLLYERTVQLKKLDQRYEALRQEYAQEVERRNRIAAYASQANPAAARAAQSDRPARAAQASVAPATIYPGPAVLYTPSEREQQAAAASPIAQPAQQRVSATPHAAQPGMRAYTVKQGDSLTRIAQAFYGDPSKWVVIFNSNRDLLDRPNQLRIGQTLQIP